MQRWLSQRMARSAGICAGVEFRSAAWLAAQVSPLPSEQELTLLLHPLLGLPGLERLREHAAASREADSPLRRVARRYLSYLEHRPQMLEEWAAGRHRLPRDQAWQATLWRAIGLKPDWHTPDLPSLVNVFCPGTLSQRLRGILARLAQSRRVDVYQVSGSAEQTHILAALGPVTDLPDQPRPQTLLGHLQDAFAAEGEIPAAGGQPKVPADQSVTVHLSHGLDRQVEVLRDTLAAAFDSDPTLEPRHVAILTPDVAAVAPLVTAAFQDSAHPATGFRLRVADQTLAENPAAALLLRLLRLPDSRMEAGEVLELLAEPPIARRFRFGPDQLQRLGELVARASIRWGLDRRHRASFGLDAVVQNTWIAGVQRLLLGIAMDGNTLAYAKTVSPADDVDSSDAALIGSLAELVARLSRLFAVLEADATLPQWIATCQHILAALTSFEPGQEQALHAALGRICEDAGEASGHQMSRWAFTRLLQREFEGRPARPGFGDGSAVVAGLHSLRWIPHRVVVLLGWDAERYPRSAPHDGDDLLATDPQPGDPDPPRQDRQILRDAVNAASQRLIVIAAGRDESTNREVAPAAPIAELMDTLDTLAPIAELVFHHPLQPFSPACFDGSAPRGYDPVSFRGAQAAIGPRAARPRRFAGPLPALPQDAPVALSDLVAFFSHPARFLLRARAGFTLSDPVTVAEEIPIDPDPLARWSIGRRYLDLRLAGNEPANITQALWLSGDVPPAGLGSRLLEVAGGDVQLITRRLPAAAAAPPQVHDMVLERPDFTLSGRVTTHGDVLLNTEFSRLQPRHQLVAWVQLLTLSASEPGPWQAVTVTKSRVHALTGPDPLWAGQLLDSLVAVYRYGMQTPIPALPRLCELFARHRRTGQDPADPAHRNDYGRCWEYDGDENWRAFFSYPEVLTLPVGDFQAGDPSEATLLGRLARLIWDPLVECERP